jgi:hypothetical protein
VGFLGETVIVVPLCDTTNGDEEEDDIVLRWDEKEDATGRF